MKAEIINQYAHTWRVFEGIVKEFDKDAWLHTGCGPNTPAGTAFHILKGVKYYIEDVSTMFFPSGISFECNPATMKREELPSPSDIIAGIGELKVKTEKWLSEIDLDSENKSFRWAGTTKLGVVLFLLRHNLYHIGELSSLLNESKNGVAEDNWVKTL
ncbi:MAG: DinB family protein [Chloroflexi bacterium]|nr:DinB family protein [Chloroflexota bacterium]